MGHRFRPLATNTILRRQRTSNLTPTVALPRVSPAVSEWTAPRSLRSSAPSRLRQSASMPSSPPSWSSRFRWSPTTPPPKRSTGRHASSRTSRSLSLPPTAGVSQFQPNAHEPTSTYVGTILHSYKSTTRVALHNFLAVTCISISIDKTYSTSFSTLSS